ncbi:hypothetical protein BHM03_00036441, partial [Ensete ventricosum]
SSFSPKDAQTPLSPSTPSSSPPAQAALAPWQPPCQGATTPAAGAAALAGRRWQTLTGALHPAPLRAPAASGCRPPLCRRIAGSRPLRPGRGWLPPLRATAPTGSRPLPAGLGRGLAVGGRPCMGAGRG